MTSKQTVAKNTQQDISGAQEYSNERSVSLSHTMIARIQQVKDQQTKRK